jgi:hypothetical protein
MYSSSNPSSPSGEGMPTILTRWRMAQWSAASSRPTRRPLQRLGCGHWPSATIRIVRRPTAMKRRARRLWPHSQTAGGANKSSSAAMSWRTELAPRPARTTCATLHLAAVRNSPSFPPPCPRVWSEYGATVLTKAQGIMQVRIVQYVLNSHYRLAGSLRKIGKRARHLSQGKRGKAITAPLQSRQHGWRMDDLAQSQDGGDIRKVCWVSAQQPVCQL